MNTVAVRTAIAVVLAGVAGTVANAVALAVATGAERLSLALVPGRYLVAIALCAALPVLDRALRQRWFWLTAIAWLTVAPSLLAKFVFGVEVGWAMVLAFNLVYALAAAVTYRIIAGPHLKKLREKG
jgi:hypothetical protein